MKVGFRSCSGNESEEWLGSEYIDKVEPRWQFMHWIGKGPENWVDVKEDTVKISGRAEDRMRIWEVIQKVRYILHVSTDTEGTIGRTNIEFNQMVYLHVQT